MGNHGFLRWQKRVYSEKSRYPVEELNWDGKPVPRFKQIDYDWNELYNSIELAVLLKRVEGMANHFMAQLTGQERPHRFRVFPWVEVFRPGDFQWPHVHTGAALCGAFFARYDNSSEGHNRQALVFEDVRGMNPPYGKDHHHMPEQDELVFFPSWAPHKFTPNNGNSTNVVFRFLLWPPGGAQDFDWEDDLLGDYTFRKKSKIKSKATAKPANPTGSTARGSKGEEL